jgi:hypothetical protein
MKKMLLASAALLVLALPASAARLPVVATQAMLPVYAPDGVHVAYETVTQRVFRLAVVDTRTARSTAIGSASSQLFPTWSRDGRLAYSSGGVLYTVSASGAGKARYAAPPGSRAPAWRPGTATLAYLARGGDLRVGSETWAAGPVLTQPSWSPDGARVAYGRPDGIYVSTGPGAETRVVRTVAEPRSVAFSPDGTMLAYVAGSTLYVVAADGATAPKRVFTASNPSPPAWTPAGDGVAFTTGRALVFAQAESGWRPNELARTTGAGASFAPTDPHANVIVDAAPIPSCPGHFGILSALEGRVLAGGCTIAGTAAADTIDGTPSWGDVIRAGAGNDRIHANDRHTDRVDCGAGRDTVWADKTDTLVHCEVIHR